MLKKLNPTMDWIKYDDDPILKTPCQDVSFPLTESDWEALSKMTSYIDTCFDNEERKYGIRAGIGITANQIGYSKRFIYIHFLDDDRTEHKYLIANPKIIQESSNICYIANGEGCLSVKKDAKGISPRKCKIVVEAIDVLTGNEIIINARGMLAICLQHEIDHSNGLLYYDRINKMNPFFVKDDWEKF